MIFASADILGRHLRPLCSRDNHAMKYEPSGSSSNNAGNQAAYHCGFMGCGVRYNLVDGYYMLIGMPDHANPVDEPGVNAMVMLVVPARECCCQTGCSLALRGPRLRLPLPGQHKGRLGKDLSKDGQQRT